MLVDEMPIASFQAPPVQPPAARAGVRQEAPRHDAPQVFNIRVALSADRHADTGALVRRMYAWRGYAFESGAASADKVTLYAETGGELVGTMSLCLDREPSRLAIDAGMSKRVFAALIHISYLYARKLHGFTDYVIEVNPRHVAFYQRMLGFADFGGERACSRVGAPAVLLRLPLDEMGAQIGKWGGSFEQHAGERSFYPYFFPLRDEPGISARLQALCLEGEHA